MKGPVWGHMRPTGAMGPTDGPNMKALCLTLLFCAGLANPALAQTQETAAPELADYDEIRQLLDSIQSRVDVMNDASKDADAAM